MPPWDLFVLDLDGTLLGPEGSVSDANQQALAHLRAMGFDDDALNRDILASVGHDTQRAVEVLLGESLGFLPTFPESR